MWWCSVNLETRGLDLIKRELGIQHDYTKFEGTAALIPMFSCVIFSQMKMQYVSPSQMLNVVSRMFWSAHSEAVVSEYTDLTSVCFIHP